MSRALTASSSAVLYCPSLRWAAERLLYRIQFWGSAVRASLYRRTARAYSPCWQAWLLRRTHSRNSALLRLGAPELQTRSSRCSVGAGGIAGEEDDDEEAFVVLLLAREPNREN